MYKIESSLKTWVLYFVWEVKCSCVCPLAFLARCGLDLSYTSSSSCNQTQLPLLRKSASEPLVNLDFLICLHMHRYFWAWSPLSKSGGLTSAKETPKICSKTQHRNRVITSWLSALELSLLRCVQSAMASGWTFMHLSWPEYADHTLALYVWDCLAV